MEVETMKTIVIAAAKGGTTKTTVTLSLAVRAAQESARVALFDLNGDQGDLTKWWTLRGEPLNPRILDVEKIVSDVELARTEGFEWLLIDTPPLDLNIIETAIMKADAVVIPVRTGFFDIDAVTPIVEMCKRRHRPYSFLLSAVDSKMPKLVEAAMSGLVGEGTIFATRLRYLQPYILSVSKGKSAAEIDRNCQTEIDHLWTEIKRLAEPKVVPTLQSVKGGRS
jgi:chromosome partitioning protein